MNFFLIRLPKTERVIRGASEKLNIIEKDCAGEGFFYSEFEENPRLFFIPTEITEFDTKDIGRWGAENEYSSISKFNLPISSTKMQDHIAYIEELKEKMKRWDSEGYSPSKIIAARVLRATTSKSAEEIFTALCKEYASACVFLFSTEKHGTWLGATPETVVSRQGEIMHAMSLAGTRWQCACNIEWDEKNLEEQRIVTDFIVDTLNKSNLKSELRGPYTLKAGPVEHLATDISVKGESIPGIRLIRRLVPTPALSGYPREEAIKLINRLENTHIFPPGTRPPSRQCYGGVVGCGNLEGEFFSYANLRSGRYDSGRHEIALYSGGGITLKSIAVKEWEETERKLSTLLKIL